VGFTEDEILYGEMAKVQAPSNPDRTIYDIKRLIGRNFHDEEVQRGLKTFPFEVIDSNVLQASLIPRPCWRVPLCDVIDSHSTPIVRVVVQGQSKDFSPEQILGKQHMWSGLSRTELDKQ
jgi:molecular chaperone DnaK (HSP70)